MKRLSILYKKMKFQKLLTIVMVVLFCTVMLLFSVSLTYLSESKIRENMQSNAFIVIEQFDIYMDNYISSIFEGFRNLESDSNLLQMRNPDNKNQSLSLRASQNIYLHKLLNQFYSANSTSVCNAYVNFGNRRILGQAYDYDLLKIDYSYDIWKERFPENKYYWVDADYCRDLIPDPDVGIVLFRLYEASEISDEGMILVALKKDFLDSMLNMSVLFEDASLSLMTDYGMMNCGNEQVWERVNEDRDVFYETAVDSKVSQSMTIDGYYYIYKKLELTDWRIVYGVEEKNISNVHYIVREVAFFTIAGILVTIILIAMLARFMSKSLYELTEKVEAKDILENEIKIEGCVEINSLSSGLERMRIRINHLLKEIEMEQEMKKQIEIALLQEQINPHFLYNTLYSCMQLCELNRPNQASEMLKALAGFYREGLNSGKSVITVEQELNLVKDYLFIQHFRYADLFDYFIECNPELLKCKIPKMSLQPLVENAIYHGIKSKREFGHICIIGETYDGEYAYLEVHDDGAGFQEEKVKEITYQMECGNKKVSPGFGMQNVNARIKFELGIDSGIEIISSSSDTCVRIRFKMQE